MSDEEIPIGDLHPPRKRRALRPGRASFFRDPNPTVKAPRTAKEMAMDGALDAAEHLLRLLPEAGRLHVIIEDVGFITGCKSLPPWDVLVLLRAAVQLRAMGVDAASILDDEVMAEWWVRKWKSDRRLSEDAFLERVPELFLPPDGGAALLDSPSVRQTLRALWESVALHGSTWAIPVLRSFAENWKFESLGPRSVRAAMNEARARRDETLAEEIKHLRRYLKSVVKCLNLTPGQTRASIAKAMTRSQVAPYSLHFDPLWGNPIVRVNVSDIDEPAALFDALSNRATARFDEAAERALAPIWGLQPPKGRAAIKDRMKKRKKRERK